MKHIILIGLTSLFAGAIASAAPTQWTVSSGGNGHLYEVIAAPSGINWSTAEAAAEARGGYLATITSSAENSFVYSLIGSSSVWGNVGSGTRGPWLGGYQPIGSAEPGGGWTWITGEAFSFQNWAAGEPNNNGAEDRIHFYGPGNNNFTNTWNDLASGDGTFAFIVESVPEPGIGALAGLSLGLLALRRRATALARR
jgi:hypothetical protein